MSDHDLLNLLNELGKRERMLGLPSILSLFRNKFNKFNNTGARMLDSIYHILLKIVRNCILVRKHQEFPLFYLPNVKMSRKSVDHKWFIDFIVWRYITLGPDVI